MRAGPGSLDDILGTYIQAGAATEATNAVSEGAGPNVAAGNMDGDSVGGKGPRQEKMRSSLDEILGMKVAKPTAKSLAKRGTTTILQEGDIVEALSPPTGSSGGSPPTFSPGMISHVYDDGSVNVDLDTGDKLLKRPPKEVRVVKKKGGSSGQLPVAIGDLAEGDRVEAR